MKWLLKWFTEDNKLIKFQPAAQFTHVPPDLTTATLYKYIALRLLFPLHSWHCYVETESNTARWQLCARGIGGKRLFEGNGRDTRWIVSDFVRDLNEATEVKMAWVSLGLMGLEKCRVAIKAQQFYGVCAKTSGLMWRYLKMWKYN
jgi:hypothetical protein